MRACCFALCLWLAASVGVAEQASYSDRVREALRSRSDTWDPSVVDELAERVAALARNATPAQRDCIVKGMRDEGRFNGIPVWAHPLNAKARVLKRERQIAEYLAAAPRVETHRDRAIEQARQLLTPLKKAMAERMHHTGVDIDALTEQAWQNVLTQAQENPLSAMFAGTLTAEQLQHLQATMGKRIDGVLRFKRPPERAVASILGSILAEYKANRFVTLPPSAELEAAFAQVMASSQEISRYETAQREKVSRAQAEERQLQAELAIVSKPAEKMAGNLGERIDLSLSEKGPVPVDDPASAAGHGAADAGEGREEALQTPAVTTAPAASGRFNMGMIAMAAGAAVVVLLAVVYAWSCRKKPPRGGGRRDSANGK
jgi:hypothetical protein